MFKAQKTATKKPLGGTLCKKSPGDQCDLSSMRKGEMVRELMGDYIMKSHNPILSIGMFSVFLHL